ncbi:CoA-binding protein [Pseudooceanicola algae]|uniref:CoA-binding domain-containing protein n=1 Tax=Pseudooceanicola algae TaxID=1537215 RepID=A0A418SCJ5_9RHOB|nr:CoA-binding protein [Pseudooceanicola algae]QPM90043.1 putative protein YccU [Pseudooceanicola algae]
MEYSDSYLKSILQRSRVIVMVGASPRRDRPSHGVMGFLQSAGYRVLPVNPGQAGQKILGEKVYASLEEVAADHGPEVDMIDIFRRPEAVPDLVAEALERFPKLSAIWMQLGVVSPEGAALAHLRDVGVVMDRCPKIEYPRLLGAA